MTDQEDNINLGKIVSDDNNQEGKWWAYLAQTCSRSLIVFLSQLFVIFMILLCCHRKIRLFETFDDFSVWLGILCSAAVYVLPSPRL